VQSGARSDGACGNFRWFYPRAYQAAHGQVFVVNRQGTMYVVDPAGCSRSATTARWSFDIDRSPPVVAAMPDIDAVRPWAIATVMADGQVLVSGGSTGPVGGARGGRGR
jgi:hypothetical protein